jgi:hypothetical protein
LDAVAPGSPGMRAWSAELPADDWIMQPSRCAALIAKRVGVPRKYPLPHDEIYAVRSPGSR